MSVAVVENHTLSRYVPARCWVADCPDFVVAEMVYTLDGAHFAWACAAHRVRDRSGETPLWLTA